jgi:hypothetical protein
MTTNELVGVIKFARAWAYVRNETTAKEYQHIVDTLYGHAYFCVALMYGYGFKY